jgi:hypothetical protein
MAEHDKTVRNHSPAVQSKMNNLIPVAGPFGSVLNHTGEFDMPAFAIQSAKATSVDAHGRLLVFAAPLVAGFHGAPLALSAANSIRRAKNTPRKNWAKRRAFVA